MEKTNNSVLFLGVWHICEAGEVHIGYGGEV